MTMKSKKRSYSGLEKLKTLEERFEYLKLGGSVGQETFGYDRYMNQQFYKSYKWKNARNYVIERDGGFDLGIDGFDIRDMIVIHHINPITAEDIANDSPELYNMENLICVSSRTHKAIHYGDAELLPKPPIKRTKGDTTPWNSFNGY